MWSGTHGDFNRTMSFEITVIAGMLAVYKGGYEVEVGNISILALVLFRRYWKCHETPKLTSRETSMLPTRVP